MAARWNFSPARVSILYLTGILLGFWLARLVARLEGTGDVLAPILGIVAMALVGTGIVYSSRERTA